MNYIQSDFIDDIEDEISKSKFTSNGAIIIAGEFQYRESNTYLEPEKTIKIIKKYTNNPIYSNDQTYIDSGILGGCIDLGQDHGETIIKIFVEICNGRDIEELVSILEPSANKYLNYKHLYEYDVDLFNLPSNVIIRSNGRLKILLPIEIIVVLLIGIIILFAFVISYFINIFRLKEEIKKRRRQEDLEKIKSDHIINISHEFRTPLNIIINTVKLLEDKNNEDKIEKEYLKLRLENIGKNSLRLLRLLNNFIYML